LRFDAINFAGERRGEAHGTSAANSYIPEKTYTLLLNRDALRLEMNDDWMKTSFLKSSVRLVATPIV
jgi:hypothetical protein